MSKRVISYGTFDLFHYGHLRILERSKKLGDYLVVGVSTDESNSLEKRIVCIPLKNAVRLLMRLNSWMTLFLKSPGVIPAEIKGIWK